MHSIVFDRFLFQSNRRRGRTFDGKNPAFLWIRFRTARRHSGCPNINMESLGFSDPRTSNFSNKNQASYSITRQGHSRFRPLGVTHSSAFVSVIESPKNGPTFAIAGGTRLYLMNSVGSG